MQQLEFKLEVFEGPLDLMLHLISKHKLNIYDIEISVLLEQYLDYISDMQAADLEVATDFLIMAARLVYIKTLSLLPRHEDGEALKRELTGQLLEYQLAKLVAGRMFEMYRGGLLFVRKPVVLPVDKSYVLTHDKQELLDAYAITAGRMKRKLPPPRTAFSGIVSRRVVSVESRIVYVLRRLYKDGSVPYDDFFHSGDKSELVATFLAMLELIKSKRIAVNEDNTEVVFNRGNIMSEEELADRDEHSRSESVVGDGMTVSDKVEENPDGIEQG